MKYFVNSPYTAESLKNEFRALSLKLHPDTGGNAEEFKDMMQEYEQIARNLSGTAQNTKQSTTASAEDVADMMGAPLRGTKGKTFADLVARLVDVFSSEELTAEYNTEGHLSTCYGWDGAALSPLSRSAYWEKFGRVVVDMAEFAARSRMEQEENKYQQSHHAAHVIEARKHQASGCQAPAVGAFVFGVGCGWKSDGGRGVFVNFEAFAADPDDFNESPRLFKVCEVYEVSAQEFADPATADRLVSEAREQGREFAGGAATDDPDRHNPRDKYRYYFGECAAVVCRESGRWYLIDAEGYSYARYCYMPTNWRTMYAQEIADAERKEAERKAEQERQEAEEKAARLADYMAKCKKYEGKMEDIRPLYEAVQNARHEENEIYRNAGYRRTAEYKEAQKRTRTAEAALMAAKKRNIIAMAATMYPGIKAKALKGDSWKGGFKLVYFDGPTLEDFEKMTDFELFSMYWEEYRMDDCVVPHREEFTDFAEKYMGEREGVYFEREMSKETKARLTSAILGAVPTAAGISWENRHEWTREELGAAAAAVGVDVHDLVNEYERKRSYFNFVDVDTLADWCFNLLAFEVAAPKGKQTSKQTAQKPQDSAETEQPTNTQPSDSDAVSAPQTVVTEAPAEGLQLIDTAEGVAVVSEDWKTTYFNKKHIKAHGCHWNKEAKRWEATDPNDVAKVRAWFALRTEEQTTPEADTLEDAQDITENATEDAAATEPTDTKPTDSETVSEDAQQPASVSPLLEAVADLFRTFADIIKEAKRWEGVTIPAATLERWKQQATEGTQNTAARLSEVCACLGSLTPDSREQFDALGVIFWTLADKIKTGTDSDSLQGATDYAAAQLFDLIERTQTENQARAVREAVSPDNTDPFRKAA